MRVTKSKARPKHRRTAAAAYMSNRLGGVPISERSLESWDIPFRIINGYAIYDEDVLDAACERMLAAAPRRMGRARRHPCVAESVQNT
jgi:hypothetical protein